MKNIFKYPILSAFLLFGTCYRGFGQDQKVQFNGLARGYYQIHTLGGNRLSGDTVTNKNLNVGHTLIDLGVNIRPNKAIQISGVMRLRNEYGGLYGAGVATTVRQLTAKGVIGNLVKYQVGDIWLKQTPYTFWNNAEEGKVNEAEVFSMPRQVVYYENFYKPDNEWRIQGAQTELGFTFDNYIKEVTVHGFGSRNLSSDYVSTQPQLYNGARVRVMQSKYFVVGANYLSLFSLDRVSPGSALMRNDVSSINWRAEWEDENYSLGFIGELGTSYLKYTEYANAPKDALTDGFADIGVAGSAKKYGLSAKLNYHDVGSEYYSAGAQTRRLMYNVPLTNFPNFRPNSGTIVPRTVTIMDMMREEGLYNQVLTATLMPFNPLYTNVLPYGLATPNRTGVTTNLKYDNKYLEAFFSAAILNEIIGEGTKNKRAFQQIKFGANVPVNAFIGWKNNFKVNIGYQSESTTRTGTKAESIDLKSSLLDLGVSIEAVEKLSFLVGFKQIEGSGNEFIGVRDPYNQISSFSNYKVNQTQNLIGLGVKYQFTELTSLAIQGQSFDLKDKDDTNLDYTMQSVFFLLNLQF